MLLDRFFLSVSLNLRKKLATVPHPDNLNALPNTLLKIAMKFYWTTNIRFQLTTIKKVLIMVVFDMLLKISFYH